MGQFSPHSHPPFSSTTLKERKSDINRETFCCRSHFLLISISRRMQRGERERGKLSSSDSPKREQSDEKFSSMKTENSYQQSEQKTPKKYSEGSVVDDLTSDNITQLLGWIEMAFLMCRCAGCRSLHECLMLLMPMKCPDYSRQNNFRLCDNYK